MLAILPAVIRRVGDPDFWWHLRTGQWIVANRAIPTHDLYTYTVADHAWTAQEYLYQVLVYGVVRVGGLLGFSLILGAVSWAGFWLVLARTRERPSSALIASAAVLLGAGAGIAVWGPRAQVVDFFGVTLELWLIERFMQGRGRALYAMPVITVLWANLHGGVIFGPFFLGAVAVGVTVEAWWRHRPPLMAKARRLWLLTAAGIAAMVVTPHGSALFLYIWRTQFSIGVANFVREWQPPNLTHVDMRGLELMMVVALAGLAWRRLHARDVVVLLAATVLALQSVRHISIFVAAVTPMVIWQWSALVPLLRNRLAQARRLADAAALAGAILLLGAAAVGGVGALAVNLHRQSSATLANYPVQASDWLAAHPSVGTRMFNEFGWGGYLANRFYPQSNRRLFVWGETELMGDELLQQYSDVVGLSSDWEGVLASHGVDYVVFPPDQPLITALDATGRWQRVYADAVAVIYVHAGTVVRA